MYGVSSRTLQRRLLQIERELYYVGIGIDGEPIFIENLINLYSPNQVKTIFKFFGEPTKKV